MRSRIVWSLLFLFCLGWAIAQIYPLVWMYYSSLKTNKEIMRNVLALPQNPQFSNWVTVWTGSWGNIAIGRYMKNSIIVSSFSLIIVLLLAYPAGYALARYRFVLNNVVITILLGTMCIPIATLLVPLYIMLKAMGLTETYPGLIFPYVAFSVPFATILSRAYFASYPREIEDAAKVDGCSDFGVFLRVIIPSSKTILATLVVVVFPGLWNEFILANIILSSNRMKTLPAGVGLFRGSFTTQWNYMFAAIAIASIPTILIYFLFQRHIVKGMTLGSVKG